MEYKLIKSILYIYKISIVIPLYIKKIVIVNHIIYINKIEFNKIRIN